MDLRLQLSEKSKEELIDEIITLYEEKEKLERKLKKYENPNTPSSSNKHIKADTKGMKAKSGAKRGSPVGHIGGTFIFPSSDKIIPLTQQECMHCHSLNTEPTGYVKSRKVVSLIKPRVLVKEYQQEEMPGEG